MGYIDSISFGNQTYSLHDTETSNILSNVVKPVVNLYDYRARTPNEALKSTPTADGTTVGNPNYDTSGYIPVVPGVRYTYRWWKNNDWDNGLTYYAFYSNNDGEASSYISGNALPSQLHLGAVAPENAAFLRVSIYKDGVAANAPSYAVVAEEDYFPNAYVEYGDIERYVYASDIVTEDELAQGLSSKADKDGIEPALVAGTAEQLASTIGTADTSLYKRRTNISGSNRVSIQQITGGTVAWNQLASDSVNIDNTYNESGITVKITGTLWKITGTGSAANDGSWINITQAIPNIIEDHVYAVILSSPIPNGGLQGMRFGFSGTGVAGIYKSKIVTATASTSETTRLQIRVLNGVTWNMNSRVCIYDLTQMFGASVASAIQAIENANEGDGVTLFRELFPNNYYPYNAGTLMSVCTNGRTSGGQTYSLDGTIELRGVPVISDGKIVFDGDTYDPDGTVTRKYGIIKLRDIKWSYGEASPSGSGIYRWYSKSSFSGFAVGTEKYIISTGRYKHVPSGGSVKDWDKAIMFGNVLYIRDDEWGNNEEQFLASLGDSFIVYELRSTAITTETAAPYQELQITGETEEFTDAGNRDVAIPVCCTATYQTNLREGLEKVLTSISSSALEYPYAFLKDDKTLTIDGAAADAKATGDKISDLKSAITPVVGFDVCKNRDSNVTYGHHWEWDDEKHMYHAYGQLTQGTVNHNIFYSTNSFPDGMSAGKKYRVTFTLEGAVYAGMFEGYFQKSSGLSYFMGPAMNESVTKTSIVFSIPSDATGMLLRFVFSGSTDLDNYYGICITEAEDYSHSQVDRVLENNVFLSLPTLRSSEPTGNNYKDFTLSNFWASCDDIDKTCVGFISNSNGVKSIPDYPLTAGFLLTIVTESSWRIQYAFDYNSRTRMVRYLRGSSTWTSWIEDDFSRGILPNNTNLNNLSEDGCFVLSDSNTYTNLPTGVSSSILLSFHSLTWKLQFVNSLTGGKKMYMRILNGTTVYKDWQEFGTGYVYNITQNVNRDTINNQYTINTSPQITTDANGWLQAIDDETTTEANATDMTGAIVSMLNSAGYCHLGEGTFYVSGNIDMPEGAILEGCGRKTIVRLLSSVTSGYIVRIGKYNTVRSISFEGGTSAPSDIYTNGTNLGSRHGIYMIANGDGQETTQPNTLQCIITDCFFSRFDGSAFYAHNTGGGLENSVIMSNCLIRFSRVGINMDYYAEYAKFSNVVVNYCYYACINNGGNNVFVGCTFHGVVGFLIDNSGSDKRNNAHGSAVGCIFNHIDIMNRQSTLGGGLAIHTINASFGFIFTGCQFWYGNIQIEDSHAIQISNSQFGNNAISISVTGDYGAFFFNNIFWTQPTITANEDTKFIDNFDETGNTVVAQNGQ